MRGGEQMLSLRIAARFLRRSRAQSALIVLGIAVGIGVQVFVGSLIVSLQKALVDETVGSSSQVTVAGREGFAVDFTPQLEAAIAGTSGVKAAAPVRTFSVIFRKQGDSAPLNVTGGDLAELDRIYGLSSRTALGTVRLSDDAVVIGVDFADTYQLTPGDTIRVVLPDGSVARMRLSGVVDLGSAVANERSAFVSPEFAAATLKMTPEQYSAVAVQLDDPFRSVAVADGWRADPLFADLTVTEWQDENKDLLDALQAQSSSSYMIQVFVLIAVALGIASTLAISAVQKTRQIGILKAMGLRDGRSAAIFVWQAVILGVTGAGLGVATGIGLIEVFNATGGQRQGSFPIDPQPVFVAVSFGVGVLVALLSAIVPSRRTSRVDPIEVIQSV